MIYSVECSFADPGREAEWNDFYSWQKLPALISVQGFRTSQRFKAVRGGCAVYLALHSIDNPDILHSDDYRQKGGGNFSRWQPGISHWRRDLYLGLERMPAIAADEALAISATCPSILVELGLTPCRLWAAAPDTSPGQRWLTILNRRIASDLRQIPQDVRLYRPIAAQLTSRAEPAGGTPH